MSLFRIYLRVLWLLGPEKWLAGALAFANIAMAGVFLVEPWLFGHVVDAGRDSPRATSPWTYIAWWTGVGFFGVTANVLVALYSDRLAHRRQLAAIATSSSTPWRCRWHSTTGNIRAACCALCTPAAAICSSCGWRSSAAT